MTICCSAAFIKTEVYINDISGVLEACHIKHLLEIPKNRLKATVWDGVFNIMFQDFSKVLNRFLAL